MESKQSCCFIPSLFEQGPGNLRFKYKTKTLASLCIELIVALSKNLILSHAPRGWRKRIEVQNRVGPGKRQSSGVCKHYFQYFLRYTCSWYTLWLVNCDRLLQYLRQSFGFARAVEKNMSSRWNPQTPHLLTPWHLTFWHKKRFFQEMGGLRYLKTEMFTGSPLLSSRRFSLVRYFAARSRCSFVGTDREPGSWLFCLTIQCTWTIYQMYITGLRFQNSEFFNWKKKMNQTYHNGICHKLYRSAFECCL